MAQLSTGTPRKVLRKASELGVHADCIASDIDGACDPCIELFHLAFDFFYGNHTSPEDVLKAVVDDLIEERNENYNG